MLTFKVYTKNTMLYIGDITIKVSDIREYEKYFVLV